MENVILYSVLRSLRAKNDAGPKAKTDINEFLTEEGFKVMDLDLPEKRFEKFLFVHLKLKRLFKGRQFDNVILQYPFYSVFLTKKIIENAKKVTHGKFLIMVHDVETLRVYDGNKQFEKDEMEIFNSADGLIVHNSKMAEWLKQHGVTVPITILGIFDYRNDCQKNERFEYQKSICFAGNLEKSTFLKKVKLNDAKLDVYGPSPAQKYQKGVTYCGVYTPDDLPNHLNENFGLIWDGDEMSACTGVFGNYMRYNAPHKTSLYLSSGIPVIIWKEAAMAEFVSENEVGIAIENLNDLDNVLQKVDDAGYRKMKSNALNLAERLRSGSYVKEAVRKALGD